MPFAQSADRSRPGSRNRQLALSGTALALIAIVGLMSAQPAQAARFGYEILGTLGGNYSIAYGLSADGSVVVGMSAKGNANNAYVWTADGGMQSIHNPNWQYSSAQAVSGDGSTVVGYWLDSSNIERAYVWTQAGGPQALPTLGGYLSSAADINADGTVIVGQSQTFEKIWRAVRWDKGVVQDLGVLGPRGSYAEAVSGNGLVVVGHSKDYNEQERAFRWEGGKLVDIGTLGGPSAQAFDTNFDGSVVVGHAQDAESNYRAFRWGDGVMNDLGTLGGVDSYAYGVNAAGTVIVGEAANANGGYNAFRWTSAGMLSVEDWLREGGVTVVSDFSRAANAVSDDGTVVVGLANNARAFVARLNNRGIGGSGIIDIGAFNATLASHPGAQAGISQASTVLTGAHGDPMRNLLEPGQQSLSITSDVGQSGTTGASGGFGIGDIGYGIGIDGGITARLSVGGLYGEQKIATGGDFTTRGLYVAPEVSIPVLDGVYATLGGYYSAGQAEVTRVYANGGLLDHSRGQTSTEVWAAKIRLDWLDSLVVADTSFTPYLDLSHTNARMDGYTETGGGFPVHFNAVTEHATIARLGVDMVTDLTDGVRLTGKVEASYRFQEETAAKTGNIVGLSGFKVAGQEINQFGLRAGIGAEFDMGPGTSFISLNGALQEDEASAWVKTGFRFKF